MKLNIYTFAKSISKEVLKNIEILWNEEGELLELLLLIRNDMLYESDTYESLQNERIYNQYQNESCQRVFRDNKELRLFDFGEFISTHSDVYFTVESCREIRPVSEKEIKKILETDMCNIICYVLKNSSKNEITKKLYKGLISDNL